MTDFQKGKKNNQVTTRPGSEHLTFTGLKEAGLEEVAAKKALVRVDAEVSCGVFQQANNLFA